MNRICVVRLSLTKTKPLTRFHLELDFASTLLKTRYFIAYRKLISDAYSDFKRKFVSFFSIRMNRL